MILFYNIMQLSNYTLFFTVYLYVNKQRFSCLFAYFTEHHIHQISGKCQQMGFFR